VFRVTVRASLARCWWTRRSAEGLPISNDGEEVEAEGQAQELCLTQTITRLHDKVWEGVEKRRRPLMIFSNSASLWARA